MATALIQFTQGGNTDVAGKAVLGDFGDFSAVTVTNGDNTGVVSWKIYLLDAPSDSSSFPPASQPQILAQAVNNTPTVAFTPDVAGTYRLMLEVTDAGASVDRDIRCFGIPDAQGFIRPPYQQNPEPLPASLPGIITRDPRPIKPDEQNYSTNVRGWSGNGGVGQLDDFFVKYRDLPHKSVTTTPYTVQVTDAPSHVINVSGSPVFNLPNAPRVGFVVRALNIGDPVTVTPQGGGANIDGDSTHTLATQEAAIYVYQGSNTWLILANKSASSGGVTPLSTALYVDINSAAPSPDGSIGAPFVLIQDAVDALPGGGGTLYLTSGDYSGQSAVTITGSLVQLSGMVAEPYNGVGPILPDITTNASLSLENIGDSTGDITGAIFCTLHNCTISGDISAGALIASSSPNRNNQAALGGSVTCTGEVNISGYAVVGLVQAQGSSVLLNDSTFGNAVLGFATITADNCTFDGSIENTDPTGPQTIRLTNCQFSSAIGISFDGTNPGLLVMDGPTYRSFLDSGSTVANATVDVIHAAPASQTSLTWDAGSPEVITILPTGHPPGIYVLSAVAIVTAGADTGTMARTFDWNSPTLGADSFVTGGISITVTGSNFQDPKTIVSDGTTSVTVTFAGAGVTGAPSIDLYAGANLVGSNIGVVVV